jgi:hypothetical protein
MLTNNQLGKLPLIESIEAALGKCEFFFAQSVRNTPAQPDGLNGMFLGVNASGNGFVLGRSICV